MDEGQSKLLLLLAQDLQLEKPVRKLVIFNGGFLGRPAAPIKFVFPGHIGAFSSVYQLPSVGGANRSSLARMKQDVRQSRASLREIVKAFVGIGMEHSGKVPSHL